MTPEEREAKAKDVLERYDRECAEWEAELARRALELDLPEETEESRERRRKYLDIVGEEWDVYVHSLTQEDYDEYLAENPGEGYTECMEALFVNAKMDAMNARIDERARAAGLDWQSVRKDVLAN